MLLKVSAALSCCQIHSQRGLYESYWKIDADSACKALNTFKRTFGCSPSEFRKARLQV